MKFYLLFALFLGSTHLVTTAAEDGSAAERQRPPLSLVVMDPLARPLSCPCVEGYAQRKYEKLADYLEKKTGRVVRLAFAESLATALEGKARGRVDLIIGKDSVVRADCREAKIEVERFAALTDKEGKTTQAGLILVARDDPAKTAGDLAGYRILFGPASCDEKHAAAIAVLTAAGVTLPEKRETSGACSDGACTVVDLGPAGHAAAVISSYAAPLLEGCGSVKKGDLRIVAETEPVPFVVAFASNSLGESERETIREALLAVGEEPELCKALESLIGFVSIELEVPRDEAKNEAAEKRRAVEEPAAAQPISWPQWRGFHRDGLVPSLPANLPTRPNIVWRRPLGGSGLGGIAATEKYVVFGDRNLPDTRDLFQCLAAEDGTPLWQVSYEATGTLDYGNSPRATPLIHEDRVFCLGAFGDLTCVDLETGLLLWRKNIRQEFGAREKLIWGTCSSPLLVDGLLIVNPGAPEASIVALEADTGDVIWKTPGARHAYASLIVATFGGVRQIVGYDRESLGGWEIASGRRIWKHIPEYEHDFNVPTPLEIGEMLFVATENNGARLFRFDAQGRIVQNPIATYENLDPDMSTPVILGNRLFCVYSALYCLEVDASVARPISFEDDAEGSPDPTVKTGDTSIRQSRFGALLHELWVGEDEMLPVYGAVIGGKQRLLVVGRGGELLLIDARADRFRVVSRQRPFQQDGGKDPLYSHPALVGTRLFLRGETELICLELSDARP